MFNIDDNRTVRYVKHMHRNQFRDDGVTPYFNHLRRVSDLAWDISQRADVWAAAILHDTPEDQFVPISFIAEMFGDDIALWVRYLTNETIPLRETSNEAEQRRTRDDLRICSGPTEVLFIKACDRFDNLNDMLSFDGKRRRKYIEKTLKFLDRLERAAYLQLDTPNSLSVDTLRLTKKMREMIDSFEYDAALSG